MRDIRELAGEALDQVPINVGFARAVVQGDAAADLWTDRSDRPRAFHAVHPYGMSLIWGDDVGKALVEVRNRVHTRVLAGYEEWLQVEPRWDHIQWATLLADATAGIHVTCHTRLNFQFSPDAFHAVAPKHIPSEPWLARPTEISDFAWSGSVVPNRFWPDARSFLDHGGGWVVANGPEIGAMAFTSFRTGTDIEIGIETSAQYRNQGLAKAATAAMISDLLQKGYTPVWSCRESNSASVRLALTLGFTPSVSLPYFHIAPANPLPHTAGALSEPYK